MDFTTAESIYLAFSFVVMLAAVWTLFHPPLTRLGRRDREYIRVLIQQELELRLSEISIMEILDELHNRGALDDIPQTSYKAR